MIFFSPLAKAKICPFRCWKRWLRATNYNGQKKDSEIIKENINGFSPKLMTRDIAEKALELYLRSCSKSSVRIPDSGDELFKRESGRLLEEAYKKVIKQINKNTMKICLYLEFYHFLGGFL